MRTRPAATDACRPHLTWRQRLTMFPTVMLATALTWLIRLTCRVSVVAGQQHLDEALARGVVVNCAWHQRLLISGIALAKLRSRGMRAGFLISPSREGEFIARVARLHGTEVMRGSSSRTGREAIQAVIEAIGAGIAPVLFADGPRGPAQSFKSGSAVIAQRTGTPMIPIGCAVNRYWQLRSWDRMHIPKPFSHFTIAFGALQSVPSESGADEITAIANRMGAQVDELTAIAESAPAA